MFMKKLQAIKDRSHMHITSGYIILNVEDRNWLFATIENLSGENKRLKEKKDGGMNK